MVFFVVATTDCALYIFIQTPFGQNWIARQVTKRLSKDLQTKITIKHVDFSLFNKMQLEGVLIEDQKGDTLLYAGDMKVRITDWFFFKKHAELKYVGLEIMLSLNFSVLILYGASNSSLITLVVHQPTQPKRKKQEYNST